MNIDDAVTIEEIIENITKGFVSLDTFGNTLQRLDFSEDYRKKLDNGVKVDVASDEGLVFVSIVGVFYAIGLVKKGRLEILARDL